MPLDTNAGLCQTYNQMPVEVPRHIDCGRYEAPWYCVQTAHKSEYHALLGLSEIGFRGHLPQILVRQRRYGKDEEVIRPLFPSYLFLTPTSPESEWGLVYRTRGIQRVFTGPSGAPTPLRRGEVERLIAMGRAGDGVIDEQAPAFPTIAPGQSVKIIDGPMANWTGVCKWSTDARIGVLMTMFSSERLIPMPRSAVIAA